jgi:hypothetical protein
MLSLEKEIQTLGFSVPRGQSKTVNLAGFFLRCLLPAPVLVTDEGFDSSSCS